MKGRATSSMKGMAWTRKEDEAVCRAYRWVSEDSVKGSFQTSRGAWTLLKAGSRHESGVNYYDEVNVFTRILYELYMEDNSKPFSHHERFGPTQVFGNVSSNAIGDEHGSPTIQETKVENPSPSEVSIPRTTGRNKAQTLKEKGKAKDDYAFQQEMVSLLLLMGEQNVFGAEERNLRHNLIGKRRKLWPNRSCLYRTILLQWQMKMMIIVFKLKLL
ncbi:hypothetical protein D8674_039709 [Pyrus ussuriensis x Pyrus communis]|uniref:Uncharacterized protein n=1 Tax=Pyrus ussuriensis x Pyrus communis TaxID=2448454 RepID=A0A5N5F7G4_9ROSA|nr:hypothetical protein D8674_039709 [Pyrus ussuriensis x Pyrus communis]